MNAPENESGPATAHPHENTDAPESTPYSAEGKVAVSVPAPDPRLARLDTEITGRREASRLLGEAQQIARWRHWAGREASYIAISAISSARVRISREIRKLRQERERLQFVGSVS